MYSEKHDIKLSRGSRFPALGFYKNRQEYVVKEKSLIHNKKDAKKHTLVINYSGVQPERIEEAVDRLFAGIFGD